MLFYEQTWFYAVVAVVGLLVIVIIVAFALLCCKVCWKCGSEDGKIYSKQINIRTQYYSCVWIMSY